MTFNGWVDDWARYIRVRASIRGHSLENETEAHLHIIANEARKLFPSLKDPKGAVEDAIQRSIERGDMVDTSSVQVLKLEDIHAPGSAR